MRPLLLLSLTILCLLLPAADGYELWLRYAPVSGRAQQSYIQELMGQIWVAEGDPTYAVIRAELSRAGTGMVSMDPGFTPKGEGASLLIGSRESLKALVDAKTLTPLAELGPEAYLITHLNLPGHPLAVVGNTPIGALYGTFHLLRTLQLGNPTFQGPIIESPRIKHRLLNHWDNLDRTVERGYAGFSIWDWHKLPDFIDPRYTDYARANASIGINGTVLTNVKNTSSGFIICPGPIS